MEAGSAETGRRVHMLLFETRRQRDWADATYADRPGGSPAHLDAIGLPSPRLTLAHTVWLDENGCALLAECGGRLEAHRPHRLGNLDRGIRRDRSAQQP